MSESVLNDLTREQQHKLGQIAQDIAGLTKRTKVSLGELFLEAYEVINGEPWFGAEGRPANYNERSSLRFGQWVEAATEYAPRTARTYMGLARNPETWEAQKAVDSAQHRDRFHREVQTREPELIARELEERIRREPEVLPVLERAVMGPAEPTVPLSDVQTAIRDAKGGDPLYNWHRMMATIARAEAEFQTAFTFEEVLDASDVKTRVGIANDCASLANRWTGRADAAQRAPGRPLEVIS